MKFIFWQNIVSPHQSYFLRQLSEIHTVILIVEKLMDEDRKKQGWEIPDLGKTEIIVIKEINEVSYLFEKNGRHHHFFSGINSYPLISKAFSAIIKNQNVNLIVESPIQIGMKTWIRYWKYSYLAFKYTGKIDNIFAMGNLGTEWYLKTGFNKQSIHRFQYTIELPNEDDLELLSLTYVNKNKFRFTFIGQLIKRKGIDTLIEVFSKLNSNNWNLNIIGNGILKNKINDTIINLKMTDRIHLLGVKSNHEAMRFLLEDTDYLILPSRFDGWGAVINEALARGVKVITNNKCGASCMIHGDYYGRVYEENNQQNLANILEGILSKKNDISLDDRLNLSKLYKIENQEKVVSDFINKFANR